MRLFRRSGKQAPAQRFAGLERSNAIDLLRPLDLGAFERDRLLIHGKVVEQGAIDGGEGLELVERAFLVEHARIALERISGVENAGAAAGAFLRMARVRRAVGAEEDVCPPRNGSAPDSQP